MTCKTAAYCSNLKYQVDFDFLPESLNSWSHVNVRKSQLPHKQNNMKEKNPNNNKNSQPNIHETLKIMKSLNGKPLC